MRYNTAEKGSVVTYILIAIFLSGLLISMLTQGANKSADTTHLDKMALYLKSDISIIHSTISECFQIYNDPVDVNNDGTIDTDDNPNPTLPLYDPEEPVNDGVLYGVSGEDFHLMKCPGAPASQQVMFKSATDKRLKMLSNTTDYSTKYYTDGTEGVYLRMTSTEADLMWDEVISRVNSKISQCSAAIETDMGDCINGCLYYWILRHPTSTIGSEVGCP